MAVFESDDPDTNEQLAALIGPGQVDHLIRQAIRFCWISLPSPKRKHPELKKQIQRIVDRALRDFREDHEGLAK